MSSPKPSPSHSGAVLDRDRLALICKALGHPIRIRILQHLEAEGQCRCGDIVDHLPLAQSTVSQHLKFLRDAGLVICETDGASTCYYLNREMIARLEDSLSRIFKDDYRGF